MGKRRLENVFIEKRSSRRDCFYKRNRGILKKAYELAFISGCGIHLVVEAEDSNVYEFHRRMSPTVRAQVFEARRNGSWRQPPLQRRMFYNGNGIMDTGMTVSPAERAAMQDPASCACFDCQNGLSSRLFDIISMKGPEGGDAVEEGDSQPGMEAAYAAEECEQPEGSETSSETTELVMARNGEQVPAKNHCVEMAATEGLKGWRPAESAICGGGEGVGAAAEYECLPPIVKDEKGMDDIQNMGFGPFEDFTLCPTLSAHDLLSFLDPLDNNNDNNNHTSNNLLLINNNNNNSFTAYPVSSFDQYY